MTPEDDEFNRIEREAAMRKEAVKETIRYRDAFPKDYALPKPWVGLTDEELSEVYNLTEWDTVNGWEYERAIEAKLREKNS